MNLTHKSLIICALLAVATPAAALTMTVMGPGYVTCAQFGQAYGKDPTGAEQFFFSWAEGEMTGLNRAQPDRAHMMDLSSKTITEEEQDIRAYCEAHPLANYYEAIEALYRTLSPPKDQ